jgi:flagellum-specific peptidoglycan hydrolase FlgJ
MHRELNMIMKTTATTEEDIQEKKWRTYRSVASSVNDTALVLVSP